MGSNNLSVNYTNIIRANKIYDELLKKCHIGRDLKENEIFPILNRESDHRCLVLIYRNFRNAESGMGFNEELHRPDIDFTCRNIDMVIMRVLYQIVLIDKKPFNKIKFLIMIDHREDVVGAIYEYMVRIHGKKNMESIRDYVTKEYFNR